MNIFYQWKKIDEIYIDKVLANWAKRVYRIFKVRAFHIEHRLNLSLLSFFEVKINE